MAAFGGCPAAALRVAKGLIDDALGQRAVLAEHQIAYSGYKTDVTVRDIRVRATRAVLTASEYTVLDLATGDPLAPKTTEYVRDHVFEFIRRGSQWTLSGHRVINDPVLNHPEPAAPGGEMVPPGSAPLEFAPAESAAPVTGSGAALSLRAALNRSAVVNYAYRYWRNYNPSYRNFSNSGSRGGDCTNFVSQALRAGGWADVPGWYQSTSAWWYNRLNESYTWVNADLFFDFTRNRQRGSLARYFSDLEPGDILQADWDNNGDIDHTMIVTYKRGGELFLTYHTNDTKDKPLSVLRREAGNRASYYAWKMH
jgi:hypothetical protein